MTQENKTQPVPMTWTDSMDYWMNNLEKHLKDSAFEKQEHLNGLSLIEYVKNQVSIVANATDRANSTLTEMK